MTGELSLRDSDDRSGATLDSHVSDPPAQTRQVFYSPAEIAGVVGLHVAVIRRAIDRGELRAYKICGKFRICRCDFEAWLDRCLVRS